jgi:hypothetical protein
VELGRECGVERVRGGLLLLCGFIAGSARTRQGLRGCAALLPRYYRPPTALLSALRASVGCSLDPAELALRVPLFGVVVFVVVGLGVRLGPSVASLYFDEPTRRDAAVVVAAVARPMRDATVESFCLLHGLRAYPALTP